MSFLRLTLLEAQGRSAVLQIEYPEDEAAPSASIVLQQGVPIPLDLPIVFSTDAEVGSGSVVTSQQLPQGERYFSLVDRAFRREADRLSLDELRRFQEETGIDAVSGKKDAQAG